MIRKLSFSASAVHTFLFKKISKDIFLYVIFCRFLLFRININEQIFQMALLYLLLPFDHRWLILFVKVILGYDKLRARDILSYPACTCLLCCDLTMLRGTLQPFQHKMLLTCVDSLSVLIYSLPPAICLSILSWKGSVKYENFTQAHAWAPYCVWGLLNSHCWPFQRDKYTVINCTDKRYMCCIVKFL